MTSTPLLQVRGLTVTFASHHSSTAAVRGIDLDVAPGEVLGIVGESGSGKSVTSFAIAGLLDSPSADVRTDTLRYRDLDLTSLTPVERRALGGREIAMVYQDALSALNPVLTIGKQLELVIRQHTDLDRSAARKLAVEQLRAVEIPDAVRRIEDYPHQFSGGQRQRVLIALALCSSPSLFIADEPTTALDVTVQAQIVDLVARLAQDRGMAVIWVTHDLGVVAGIADRVAVMRSGRIVEHAPTAVLFAEPRHPYTRGLLGALPTLESRGRRLSAAATHPWVEGHSDGSCGLDDCRLSVPANADSGHEWACFTAEAVSG